MQIKRLVQFGLLFLLLAGFSLASLGIIQTNQQMINTVSALESKGKGNVFVQVQDEAFDSKVLRFLKEDKVCALTESQKSIISASYPVEEKVFTVNGNNVPVLYVKANPLNKNIIEGKLGQSLDSSCQVVHGNKVIALLSPIFVS